jgi:hypothetical protein
MMFRAQVVANNSDWGVPRWAKLEEQRIALQNRASNMLSACGLSLIEEALSSEEKLTAVLELPRDEVARMQLRVIAGQI